MLINKGKSNDKNSNFLHNSKKYLNNLSNLFTEDIVLKIEKLANHLKITWEKGKNIYIFGNGGSACNAMHVANDFHYGAGTFQTFPKIKRLKVEALPLNPVIINRLGNDIGYENTYSHQLENKSKKGDLLIALSGSGNSPNIVSSLKKAKKKGIFSYAILFFSEGACLNLADYPINFPINDM